MEEVLRKIKTKIREKQMKKKKFNDRQIKENYKEYLQLLFDIQTSKRKGEDDDDEDEEEEEDNYGGSKTNNKYEQGK